VCRTYGVQKDSVNSGQKGEHNNGYYELKLLMFAELLIVIYNKKTGEATVFSN
jgi:hypothetical protein